MRKAATSITLILLSILSFEACGASKASTSTPVGSSIGPTGDGDGGTATEGSPKSPVDPALAHEPATTTTATLGDAGDLTDARLPPAHTASTGAGDAGPAGPVSAARTLDSVTVAVKAQRDQARACYDAAAKAHPDLPAGKLIAHFVIDQKGMVTESSLGEGSDVTEPSVVNCVLAILQGLQFGPSANNRKSIVNYPFIFNKH